MFDQASLLVLLDEKHISVPPRVVIEVDVKIDLPANINETQYVYNKTHKLLNFGAGKVIWILTKRQRNLITKRNERWDTDRQEERNRDFTGVQLRTESVVAVERGNFVTLINLSL